MELAIFRYETALIYWKKIVGTSREVELRVAFDPGTPLATRIFSSGFFNALPLVFR